MTYYAFIENDKINGIGECRQLTEGVINFEITEEIYNDIDHYIWDGSDVILDPDYEEKQAQKERQRLDSLTLTPADVERALYRAKGMDFEDLKVMIAQALPQVDIKGLAIEFRAKDFYRGAMASGMRLFDVVGQLLGYTPADMDYLFEHKELPVELPVEDENV